VSITQLVILAAIAIVIGQMKRSRLLALLGVSTLIIYWLQPPQSPVNLTFWLPTATLALTALAWSLTSAPETRGWQRNWQAAFVVISVIVLADMNRYFQFEQVFTTLTPRMQWVGAAIVIILAPTVLMARVRQFPALLYVVAIVGLIAMLVLIKMPSALGMVIETVSAFRGKEAGGSISISWLGFSYVSFRLIHTILDRKAGRLPSVTLEEYVNYVVFFPSFSAGPIDRLERFVRDLNAPIRLDREGWMDAGGRFLLGMFKKFVLADGLAWIALNDAFAWQAKSAGWMWILLYAYSLRIYLDFSGYTDVAIGLGRFMGVRLPENFAAPYLKPNLTQFWNSWHMTLTQWFRAYFFNPLTRMMRSARKPVPLPLIILLTQIGTMILIGLWHGFTAGFVLWGLWHGMGLFIQNRWTDFIRTRMPSQGESRAGEKFMKFTGMFLTFNFVSLGWLFFIFPTPALAWRAALRLFGVA
jgi:D-alanyl-lipoteichoic acid acyltransferase DltB (MBOAT superfamily)